MGLIFIYGIIYCKFSVQKNPRSRSLHFVSYKHNTERDMIPGADTLFPTTEDFMKSYNKYLDTIETCRDLKRYSKAFNAANSSPAKLIYSEKIEDPNRKGIFSVEYSARFSWSFLHNLGL